MLRAGLAGLGIRYLAQPGFELPMLNAVAIPEGVDDADVRRQLLGEFGLEIGGGLGQFKGNAWRIGLMGSACTPNNLLLLLAALEKCLTAQHLKIEPGAGVGAALESRGA